VPESYRIFIAIEFPREIRALVAAHIERLRQAFPDVAVSWNHEDNLHLTLKFLGNVPVSEIEKLSSAVAASASQIEPFRLKAAGCGSFPARGRPNVLWIGVEDSSSNLLRLHHHLEDNCANAGFSRDARAFHPHLTIARLRKPNGARELADVHRSEPFAPEPFAVSEVVVFRSELLPKGARHSALFRHQLKSAAE
jgi:2'-5' RNA ligase